MIVNYVEINIVCIIFLLLLRTLVRNMDTASSKQRALTSLIWSTVAFCLADMTAGVFRGMMGPGARAVIEISNELYFELLVVISYLWCVYVYARLAPDGIVSRKAMMITALPVVAFALLTLTNPLTHFLFSIDAQNLYKRGNGVYLHWVVVWLYFLVPTFKALHVYEKETSSIKKQEIKPLLFFAIAPFVASLIQMAFYGVTTTQVGITVSIVMICLKSQESQILKDALTGVNNRRALTTFMENQMLRNKETVYTLAMIDVNHFKQINDKYGHMVGDLVLKRIAEALKEACKVVTSRIQVSRFGGDEFVILGLDCTEEEVGLLLEAIANEMKKESEEKTVPCEITVSVGCAQGPCTQEKDFKQLIEQADQEMYKEKAKLTKAMR